MTATFAPVPPAGSARAGRAFGRQPGRPVVGPVRRPAHVYRRRRAVAGASLAGVVALVSMVATGTLAGSGGVPASASGAQPAVERVTHVARPGDTLWSLAHDYRGDVPHAAYVDRLVRLNGGASIQAGQVLILP